MNSVKRNRKKPSIYKRLIAASKVFFHSDMNLVSLLEEELDDSPRYMVDFRQGHFSAMDVHESEEDDGEERLYKNKKNDIVKVSIKPKDVLHELERIPTKWSLEGLDDKIAMMKEKIKLINQNQTKKEAEVLLELLENRKKYNVKSADGTFFWVYFSQFDITHDGHIKKLLDKYSLVMESADIFIPEFPVDATRVMTTFSTKFCELTEKKPRFFVIATKESFKKNYSKRDPILLAQSPFGFYYHILGAWDQEMLYLPEL